MLRLDFGPEMAAGIPTELPPKSGAEFAAWVSAVDQDGNELAGIRPVELRVPLATVTGWNEPKGASPDAAAAPKAAAETFRKDRRSSSSRPLKISRRASR